MPQLDYIINIKADNAIATLRALEAELSKDIIRGRIKGLDVSDLERQLKRVQETISGMGIGKRLEGELAGLMQSVPVVGRVFNALNGAAGPVSRIFGALGFAAAGAKHALSAWADEEKSIVALNAALAATGQLSPSVAAKLRNLAEELKASTNIDDGQWKDSFATLIRLGGVSAMEMDRHAKAVVGLAGLIGGDLYSATMLYTRALNGNFEMLSRHGIKLDENASKTEKLAQLQQIASRAAGIQAAQVNTLSGAWRSLKLALNDAWQSLGEFFDKGLGLTELFKVAARQIRDWLPKRIDSDVSNLDNLENTTKDVAERLREVGLGSDQLDDLGAAAAENAASGFSKLNEQLRAKLDLDRAMLAAEREQKLAKLSLQETEALSQPGLTDEDKRLIRADFTARRAMLKAESEQQTLAIERDAIAQLLASAHAERQRRVAAIGALQADRDIKADAVAEAEKRVKNVAPEGLARLMAQRFHKRLERDNAQMKLDSGLTSTPEQRQKLVAKRDAAARDLAEIEAKIAPYERAIKTLENAKKELAKADAALAAASAAPEGTTKKIEELENQMKLIEAKIAAAKLMGEAELAEAELKTREANEPRDKIEKTVSFRAPDVASLERIGASLGALAGAPRTIEDYARRTAIATEKIAENTKPRAAQPATAALVQ